MKRSFISHLLYFLTRNTVLVFFHLIFRGVYYNWKYIPRKGRVIIACNHQSHLDPPIVGSAATREMGFMAKVSLFRGLFGKWIECLNAFPVDQEKPLGGIKEALRRLKNDEGVVVFPEGTRTLDGEPHEFLAGLIILAQKTQSPIVPAAIEGAFDVMPRGEKGKFHLFKKIAVRFSEPIPVETVMSLSSDELMALVKKRIIENLNELRKLKAFHGKKQIEV